MDLTKVTVSSMESAILLEILEQQREQTKLLQIMVNNLEQIQKVEDNYSFIQNQK